MTTKPDPVRSRTMRAVKSKNTGLELRVRKLVHALGYRYRLHRKDLAGTPDLVFVSRRKVIFIHGCFWHGHGCPRGSRQPKANAEYWRAKIDRNRARDVVAVEALAKQGWRSLVIWECETRRQDALSQRVTQYLDEKRAPPIMVTPRSRAAPL